MHPMLSPSRIKDLPPNLKTLVVIGCAPDAALGSVEKVVHEFNHGSSLTARVNMLAAIYIIIDPRRIPDTQNDTYLATETVDIVKRAWTVLHALGREVHPVLSYIPKVAGLEMWARMWPWFQLIDRYRTTLPFLPTDEGESKRVVSEVLVTIVAALSEHHNVEFFENLCSSRPGVVRMVVCAWSYTHGLAPPARARLTRSTVLKIIEWASIRGQREDEILESVGGSMDELARVAMLHFEIAVDDLEAISAQTSEEDRTLAAGTFSAIFDFLRTFEADPLKAVEPHGLLGSLANRGFIRVLLKGIAAYDPRKHAEDTRHDIPGVITQAFNLLFLLFRASSGHLRLEEAIKHGLFQSLLRFAACDKPPVVIGHLFRDLLPAHTIRVNVLAALRDNVFSDIDANGMRAASASPALRKSPLFKDWTELMQVVQRRMTIFYRYNAGEFPPLKMCDNHKCARVGPEALYKRCSGCRILNYCSESCQKVDWKEGQHKQGCASLRTLSLHESTLDISSADRDFLRALVDQDNAYYKLDTIRKTSHTLVDHPDCSCELVTRYTYVNGDIGIHVLPAATSFSDERLPLVFGSREAWEECIRRVAHSGGKMVCEVVGFLGGGTEQYCVMPLRVRHLKMPQLRRYAPLHISKPLDQFVGEMVSLYQALQEDENPGCAEFH
ncbi:hypothetical protein C8F01DRAFT_1130368 [Mycena amicta]|nr:hypothetical protein C8F01DRAFT_1130368 [Mycena amicta]